MSWLPRDNNVAELKAFEDTCQRLSGFEKHCTFEWVDGFLTGLAAGPGVPETAIWLQGLCGDGFERAFADPADHLQALRSLKARLSVLQDQLDPEALLNDPEGLRLNPLMAEWTDADRAQASADNSLSDDEAQWLQSGLVWGDGFIAAVERFQDDRAANEVGQDASAPFLSLVEQIRALGYAPGSPSMQSHLQTYFAGRDAPVREELIEIATVAAQELRLWWVEHAPKPSTRSVEKQPGRNEPCHCGSGKKFKKCHGA